MKSSKELRPFIFLDLDGVTHPAAGLPPPANCKEACKEIGRSFFHIPQVARLKELCCRTHSAIVLISSWRTLKFPLSFYNSLFAGKVQAVTPELHNRPPAGRREEEIISFLKHHSKGNRFVIFDDQESHYKTLKENLVVTNSQTGVTEKNIDEGLRVLQGLDLRF